MPPKYGVQACIFWTLFAMVKPPGLNFRLITANFHVSEYLGFLRYKLQPNGEAQEIMSVRQGPVRLCRVLPTPDSGKIHCLHVPILYEESVGILYPAVSVPHHLVYQSVCSSVTISGS